MLVKMLVAAALMTVVFLVLVTAISQLRDEDASWGHENVVRTTTIALTPAPPSSLTPTPDLRPARPPAGGESDLRARPAVAEPVAPQR